MGVSQCLGEVPIKASGSVSVCKRGIGVLFFVFLQKINNVPSSENLAV